MSGLSAARVRALLAYSWDVLSLMDRQGRLLYNSPAGERLHGFKATEMEGRSTFEYIHPEDVRKVSETFQHCLDQPGLPVRVEYRYARKDGTWIWMEAVGVNLLDHPEVRAIVVNSRDVSDRVETEQARRESEARYRDLFTYMLKGFALCRMLFRNGVADDFVYVEVNPAFSQLTGLKDVVGRKVSEVIPGIREADPELFERYERVVRTGEPERFEVFVEALKMWFAISVYRPMPDHFVAIFDVIDARKRAEEERFQLERQLHQVQKMESLGSLAGGVAHDMNNVLGSILGLASLHEEMLPPDSPARQAFATIGKACHRGADMVRRLLNFAREGLSEVKVLDLNALIEEEAQLLERTTLAQVQLVQDLDPGLRPIQGEASSLIHALMNLCVNAVDAMPGGGLLTLRTRNVEPGWVQVEVEDTGTGMPKEVMEKALDPFFTTKPQGQGTGLGLSIVYGTVKAHQGLMEVHSEPGQGTRIVLRFPTCEGGAEDGDSSSRGRNPAPLHLDLLLVDDDDLLRPSLEAVLTRMGHRVTSVASGEAALERLGQGLRPQLVLLDLNMPGMGGAETFTQLRRIAPDLPVLLITGRADASAWELTQGGRWIDLLPKPFSMAALKTHLEALVPLGEAGSPLR